MIAFLLAMLLTPAPERPPPAMPPPDWSVLPQLPLHRPLNATPETSAYVRDEVLRGHCASAVRDAAGWSLGVDVAVLTTADGRVRRVVPRAIQCPTIEQYAAGLVWSGARDNLDPRPGDADRWYRMRVTFAWSA